jgi:beta-glucuronidase
MITIDLNGLWDFIVDLDPKYHYSENSPYARPNWDRSNWQKVPVPGVWNKYAERLDIYEGVCWFVREFNIESLDDRSISVLRFGGINYKCRIFLNGELIRTHEGGYTEFTADVTGEIQIGKNCLAIEVDNRATHIKMPPCLGYFNYGGIHRNVTLEIHQKPDCIRDVFFDAKPTDNGGGIIRVRGRIIGCNNCVGIKLICNGYKTISELSNKRSFDISMNVPNVRLWSPDSPNLYKATIQLIQGDSIAHEISRDIGFRSIEMSNGKIILNKKPTFLKGICYLYDSPIYGVTMKPDQYMTDIALFKELGINTIRSHFPFANEFYEACDREGIMIWIETPIYCIHPPDNKLQSDFADPDFRELAITMTEEMIIQARSHPSVIIYSLGNECNVEHPEAESFFQELANKARELDDTRLLSYASLYCNVGSLANMVDVLGINEYWGWYDRIDNHDEKSPTKPIDLNMLNQKLNELKHIHNKSLLLTEFGADSIPNYISGSCNLWSEDYHADLIEETFKIIRNHPEICGAFPFCFSDYRDPSKYTNKYWDEMNYKGIVTYNRLPKKAFYRLKGIYNAFLSD